MPYRLIPRRLRERLGRRGLVLLLFGLAWVVQGLSFFLLADLYAAQPAQFPLDRVPLDWQGGGWIASGIVAGAVSCRRRLEPDGLGFVAVSLMPLAVGGSYLVGAVSYFWAGNPLWVLGALGFLAWAPIILALGVVASWYEPPVLGGDQ